MKKKIEEEKNTKIRAWQHLTHQTTSKNTKNTINFQKETSTSSKLKKETKLRCHNHHKESMMAMKEEEKNLNTQKSREKAEHIQ
jgi:cobyrinic acid a,c-diamide synthase